MIGLNALRICTFAVCRSTVPVAACVRSTKRCQQLAVLCRTFAAKPYTSKGHKGAKTAQGKQQGGSDKLNGGIQASEMRVVYTDPNTQNDTWKIMSKQEALQLAKSQDLDLILVNPMSSPPVCKIQNYTKYTLEKAKKEKEARMKQKSVKEMSFGVAIAPHDLEVKCQKVRDFLDKGHQVQITLSARRYQLKNDPAALDKVTYSAVTALEHDVASLQQLTSKSPLRRDFMLFPKKTAIAGAKKSGQRKQKEEN